MPTDDGRRLQDFQRVQYFGGQPIEPGKYQAVDIGDGDPLRRSTPQHVELVSEDEDLSLQCCPRPEQPCYGAPDSDLRT